MSEAGGEATPTDAGSEPEAVLRAKYLDYCSAQVADLLLLLSPDEIYVLAQDAAREAGRSEDLTYDSMVELATRRLSARMPLPPFERWLVDYKKHPHRYEGYLMGLWKSELELPSDA